LEFYNCEEMLTTIKVQAQLVEKPRPLSFGTLPPFYSRFVCKSLTIRVFPIMWKTKCFSYWGQPKDICEKNFVCINTVKPWKWWIFSLGKTPPFAKTAIFKTVVCIHLKSTCFGIFSIFGKFLTAISTLKWPIHNSSVLSERTCNW